MRALRALVLVPVLAAVALLVFEAGAFAASGDFLVFENTDEVTLNAAQASALSTFVISTNGTSGSPLWTGSASDIRGLTCSRATSGGPVRCSLRVARTLSPASVPNAPTCIEGKVP